MKVSFHKLLKTLKDKYIGKIDNYDVWYKQLEEDKRQRQLNLQERDKHGKKRDTNSNKKKD